MKKFLSLIFISIFLLINLAATPRSGELRLVMLDIGQGDSFLVRTPQGLTILIDGGPDNSVLQQLGSVLPWWQRRIDYVIMTHPDTDHSAGLLGVIEKYQVGEFWFNGSWSDSDISDLLAEALAQRRIRTRVVRAGDIFRWPEGLQLQFIWPTAAADWQSGDTNALSLVWYLSWGGQEILFTGDADQKVEASLITDQAVRSAEILKVAHHGSRYSSGQAFLTASAPEVCLISVGQANKFGHPAAEVLERLRTAGCRTYQTFGGGSLELRLASSSYQIIGP